MNASQKYGLSVNTLIILFTIAMKSNAMSLANTIRLHLEYRHNIYLYIPVR